MSQPPLLAGWEQYGPDARYVVAVHRKVMPDESYRYRWWNAGAAAVILAVACLAAATDPTPGATAPLFLFAAMPAGFGYRDHRRANSSLRLDPDGVTVTNAFGARRVRWSDLDGVTVREGVGVVLVTRHRTVLCDALRTHWGLEHQFRATRDPGLEAESVLVMNNAASWLETTRISHRVAAAGQA